MSKANLQGEMILQCRRSFGVSLPPNWGWGRGQHVDWFARVVLTTPTTHRLT